ncbi:hypothetical protein BASA84_001698 [Batrachochytrium salamandrivorans]|nr:hypothetical protein BASA81_007155 [Batrachochytrium salamandrivorans]KAH9265425.1 hypothetical protein BASA84_001698 [Batrachochytrium salamandrivorans]
MTAAVSINCSISDPLPAATHSTKGLDGLMASKTCATGSKLLHRRPSTDSAISVSSFSKKPHQHGPQPQQHELLLHHTTDLPEVIPELPGPAYHDDKAAPVSITHPVATTALQSMPISTTLAREPVTTGVDAHHLEYVDQDSDTTIDGGLACHRSTSALQSSTLSSQGINDSIAASGSGVYENNHLDKQDNTPTEPLPSQTQPHLQEHGLDSGISTTTDDAVQKRNHRRSGRTSMRIITPNRSDGQLQQHQIHPPMLMAEMTAHESYSLARPGSGVWVPLGGGDDDAWGAGSPNRPDGLPQDSSFSRPSWAHGGPWNPSSRSWPLPVRGVGILGGRLSRRDLLRRQWSRLCCFRITMIAGLGLLITIITSVVIVTMLHQTPVVFDASSGPRGSIPGTPPGPPLPVLGVLGLGNPSGRPAIYFGASIDWDTDDPEHFNSDLGHAASIHDSTFYLTSTSLLTSANVNSSGVIHTVSDIFAWTAALIRGTGAIMGITIIPLVPLNTIQTGVLEQLARKCLSINNLGVPVMLRYAPQMNGNWFPYGQDPAAYRASFIKVAGLVHDITNSTAMVWSPVSGLNYPFRDGRYAPTRGDVRYRLLDTNKDGILSNDDDPFLPYYPGDDAVDWVGISLLYTSPTPSAIIYPVPAGMPFPFPLSTNSAQTSGTASSRSVSSPTTPSLNTSTTLAFTQISNSSLSDNPKSNSSSLKVPSNIIADPATQPTSPLSGPGLSDTAGVSPVGGPVTPPYFVGYDNVQLPPPSTDINSTSFESQLITSGTAFNFYLLYAERRQKPLIVSETGAAFYPSDTSVPANATELLTKNRWSQQVFSYDLLQKYPLIRAIVVLNKAVSFRATSRYLGGSLTPGKTGPVPVADFAMTYNPQVLAAFRQTLLPLILAVNVTTPAPNSTMALPPTSTTVLPLPDSNTTVTLSPETLNLTGFLIFANGTAVVLNGSWTVSGARTSPKTGDGLTSLPVDPTFSTDTSTSIPTSTS